jgi:SAM-dependent methyltransferase
MNKINNYPAKQIMDPQAVPDLDIEDRAEYDHIASDYKASKQLAFRIHIEEYTLFKILGNIEGKHILDFACGEGHYTRKLKKAGAAGILGIDLSAEMIELARISEITEPLGCEYLQRNISEFQSEHEADVVVAMYLLNYAKTRDELLEFCTVTFNSIRSGGRFVGFNDNIALNPMHVPSYEKFGFTKTCAIDWIEGDPITYRFDNRDGSHFQFNNYYLSGETYRWAFETAGFKDFRWIAPMLDPKATGLDFWQSFLDFPAVRAFEAFKT